MVGTARGALAAKQVSAHRVGRDPEVPGDLGRTPSVKHLEQNLPLPFGKDMAFGRHRFPRPHQKLAAVALEGPSFT